MKDRVLIIVEQALEAAEEEFLQANQLLGHKTEEELAQQAGKSTMTYGDILRKYEQDCTDMKQCIEWVKRQGD